MLPAAPLPMQSSQQYLNISRRALDVEDYIDILRRHTSWIMGPLFAGLVISCVIAFLMQNTYVSSAVMRISPPQISEVIVPAVLNQQIAERLGQMQQEILSRTSLSELIQRPTLNLYPRERSNQPLEDVIERMRTRDVRVDIISLAGQGSRPASAFRISFAYFDRFKAQAVVQALINKYMDSMQNVQNSQGKVTTDFIKDELTQARGEVNRLDNELTQFRIQNAGHLPEELQMNMQAYQGLTGQLSAANDSIARIKEDKLTLQTNLQNLKNQRDTFLSAVNTVPETQAQKAHNERLETLNREVAQLEEGLLQAQQIYADNYPLVKNVKAQIALKKRERDAEQVKEDEESLKPKPVAKKVVPPQVTEHMNDIQGAIDMVNVQLKNKADEELRRMKAVDDINRAMETFQNRIAASPTNQQKYLALIREHENAVQHYSELQKREAVATLGDDVGKRKAGENLEVLDNASLPEAPTAPNRWLICGIGLGVGLMAGVFLTGVKEMKDTSLKNLKDVRAYTNLPILSSIPLLENDLLVRRKRRLAYVGWSAAVILGIVAMSGSMYYHFFLTS